MATTILSVVTLLIFGLVLLRFVRRVAQERQRQRTLTWPRTTARLGESGDALKVSARDAMGVPIFYRAELVSPYTFYARGQRYTGDRLAPELERLNPAEAKLFLRGLSQHRSFEICYNPDDPTDNYLTVGKQLLRNRQLVMYVLVGVVLPAALALRLVWGQWFSMPLSLFLMLLFGFFFFFVALYYSLQATPDLGALLIPTPAPPAREAQENDLLASLEGRPQPVATPEKVLRS